MSNKFLTYIATLVAIMLMASCSKNDMTNNDPDAPIMSNDVRNSMKELAFILKPYVMLKGEKKYIATDSIFNVKVKINGKLWGNYSSLPVDISKIKKEQTDDYMLSDTALSYGIVAYYSPKRKKPVTAKDYADLLYETLHLPPGEYICQIESFDILMKNKQRKSVQPLIMKPINVEEGTRSLFVGNFEVLVD